MKKTLITLVLSTFLLSMPVASEARTEPSGEEVQAISTPVSSSAPAFLQSIGIGRRRTVRRRRMVRRRVHRRTVRRRMRSNRGRHRGVYMRRSVRRPRTIRVRVRPRIPRAVGVGVRRGRRNY
jgi:hypothetical protein